MKTLIWTGSALAIVVEDQSALRAEPRRSATQHAVLWAGDTLEVRGEESAPTRHGARNT